MRERRKLAEWTGEREGVTQIYIYSFLIEVENLYKNNILFLCDFDF